MRVVDNIKVDFELLEGDRMYECSILFEGDDQENRLYEAFEESNIDLDTAWEGDITARVEAWKYETKEDFIQEVRSIVKTVRK